MKLRTTAEIAVILIGLIVIATPVSGFIEVVSSDLAGSQDGPMAMVVRIKINWPIPTMGATLIVSGFYLLWSDRRMSRAIQNKSD